MVDHGGRLRPSKKAEPTEADKALMKAESDKPSRSEAIRRLVEEASKAKRS